MLTVGSLFSGVGGLDLGLERAGMHVMWQAEKDAYRRSVLAARWPLLDRYQDVRHVNKYARRPSVLAGGFPCQPWSSAGLRKGVDDERWLWPEFARIIRLLRPRYVVVENAPELLDGGIEYVLGDLAACGYDAEWSVLSACAVGAPHTRDRLFLVAYANRSHGQAGMGFGPLRPRPLQALSDRARAWRDRVDGSLEAARSDDREADGAARRMVAAGGAAVVPDVAEYIGRMIVEAENDHT